MQNLGWKTPVLWEFEAEVNILSTRDLICQKFAAVFQKIATSCHAHFFSSHDATGS